MLTPDAIEVFEKSVLCWLATADKNGDPSVSPKEIFIVRSADELLIADIASPRSVRNIANRSEVCVAAIDIFEQRGYQVFGTAHVIDSDAEDFGLVAAPLCEVAGPQFPVRSVIRVSVERLVQILAPSIWMFPNVPVEDRRRGTMKAYGVRELADD